MRGEPCDAPMYGNNRLENKAKKGRPCDCVQCSDDGPLLNYNYKLLNHFKSEQWKNRPKTENGAPIYDVVYVGGGVASLISAYHMVVHAEGGQTISIAVIDPRSEARDNVEKDLKVGESLVAPSATFLMRELGLLDYMFEHSPPKNGLYFWWAKNPHGKTDSQSDYVGMYESHPHEYGAFQLNRATFEAHLLSECMKKGVKYFRGFGKIAHLGSGGQLHQISVTMVNLEDADFAIEEGYQPVEKTSSSSKKLTMYARQLVDGAGRKFLIGNMRNTMIKDTKDLYGVNNASVWVRVKNEDLSFPGMFHGDSGWNVHKAYSSFWYATGHYFGVGHWLWVIPIEKYGAREVSIGVSFHKDIIPLNSMNSVEKFYAFLKANHEVLYKVCASAELVDFQVLPKLPHINKQPVSNDNWYCMGESVYNADPFYSTGLVFVSYQTLQINALMYGKLAGVNDAHIAQLAQAYNTFQVGLSNRFVHQISHHDKHLGNASVMAWRIYGEVTSGSLAQVLTQTRWFLCPKFAVEAGNNYAKQIWLYEGYYTLLDEVHALGLNPGMMNVYTDGQAILFGKGKHHKPMNLFQADDLCSNWIFDFQRVNIFRALRNVFINFGIAFFILAYKCFGWKGVFRPMVIKRLLFILVASFGLTIKSIGFDRQMKNAHKPLSLNQSLMYLQHKKEYRRPLKVNPWSV